MVFKMYTTLKLYYLHQQELLNQVLAILKEHIHSKELASTLFAYIRTMHGKNFGWVSQIEALLKSHINLNQGDMYRLISHQKLVHSLHTIVHHAAVYHHAAIGKMYGLMKRYGYARHFHKTLLTHAKKILHRVTKTFKHTHTSHTTHTVTHHNSSSSHSSSVKIHVHKHTAKVSL